MGSEIEPIRIHPGHDLAAPKVDSLAAFLAGRNERTLAAYAKDMTAFARFLNAPGPGPAGEYLLAMERGQANALVLAYKADMAARKLSAATINRRLATLRSFVKLARTLGRVGWALDVENAKAEPYRDTRGPGRAGFRRLLDALDGRADAKAVRDRAILRLLYGLGLSCTFRDFLYFSR